MIRIKTGFATYIFKCLLVCRVLRLTENHHGFMPHKTTVTNLSLITTFMSNALDKLNNYSFSDHSVKLMNSYLLNRKYSIIHKGYKSRKLITQSGIPQKSTVGLLLFLYFINDLDDIALIFFSKYLKILD